MLNVLTIIDFYSEHTECSLFVIVLDKVMSNFHSASLYLVVNHVRSVKPSSLHIAYRSNTLFSGSMVFQPCSG